MKKTLLLAAALACSGAVAQEKEIWACQQEEGTLLDWEDGRWKQYLKTLQPLLLTLDGDIAIVKEGDKENRLSCSKHERLQNISCLNSIMSMHLYFSTDTARLGKSNLFGATSTGDRRDSVSVSTYNCTKF